MKGFLLGAGSSFNLGLPLVDELTKEFKNIMFRLKEMPYYKVPNEISEILFPLLNNSALNYEDIIGRIEVETKRFDNRPLYQEWHGLLSRYLETIHELLLERHAKNKHYIRNQLDLLSPITSFCDKEPLWIFSLNHDVMIEIICSYFNIPLTSGFNDTININNIDFESLTRDEIDNNKFSYISKGPGINLIKLHGSLDLFVKNDEKNYVKIKPNKEDPFKIIDDICYLRNNDVTIEKGVKCTNQFTYNDKNGLLQFLQKTVISGKHKYSSKISHTMDDWFYKIYKGHINYVSELFCIGYGFQDKHINEVILEWMESSRERKLIIVNPGMGTIPPQFTHLSDQIKNETLGFLGFLHKNSDPLTKTKVNLAEMLRQKSRKRFLH